MADNFNYISLGDWEAVKGHVDQISMRRGRMFEYTPSDTEKRLELLNPTSTNFLASLPTFLCSEHRQAGNGVFMLIKFGWVSNIIVQDEEVSSAFETKIDFEEVSFDDLETAASLFCADKFQLYRTHWAVREGDAQAVLDRLTKHKPEIAHLNTQQAWLPAIDAAIAPPSRDKKSLGDANSVESFLALLYKARETPNTEMFFRGHGDESYELTPSLLRKWENGDWQYLPNEDRLCKELLITHYDEFQDDQYTFDRLVRMQHYGLPTRLLDISINPLVALFFACFSKHDQVEKNGEVIIFRVSSDLIKYYDSDTVSCLSNLSSLNYEQKNEIDLGLKRAAFNETDVAKRLLHHIRSEKAFFEPRIVPSQIGSIVCVKAKRTNTRIKSQSGAFLLFGHEAALPDAGQNGIEISRVTIQNKLQILAQLNQININAMTVYPSIDQTTVHLRDQYQSRKRHTSTNS